MTLRFVEKTEKVKWRNGSATNTRRHPEARATLVARAWKSDGAPRDDTEMQRRKRPSFEGRASAALEG